MVRIRLDLVALVGSSLLVAACESGGYHRVEDPQLASGRSFLMLKHSCFDHFGFEDPKVWKPGMEYLVGTTPVPLPGFGSALGFQKYPMAYAYRTEKLVRFDYAEAEGGSVSDVRPAEDPPAGVPVPDDGTYAGHDPADDALTIGEFKDPILVTGKDGKQHLVPQGPADVEEYFTVLGRPHGRTMVLGTGTTEGRVLVRRGAGSHPPTLGVQHHENVELELRDAAVRFDVYAGTRAVSFHYQDRGGEVFIQVGQEEPVFVDEFRELHNGVLPGGAQVLVRPPNGAAHQPSGVVFVVGSFGSFTIGGERLLIDDVCFQYDDCAGFFPEHASFLGMRYFDTAASTGQRVWNETLGLDVKIIGGGKRRLEEVAAHRVIPSATESAKFTAFVVDKNGSTLFEEFLNVPAGTAGPVAVRIPRDPSKPEVFLEDGETYRVHVTYESAATVDLDPAELGDPNYRAWLDPSLRYLVIGPYRLDGASGTWSPAGDYVPPIELKTSCP